MLIGPEEEGEEITQRRQNLSLYVSLLVGNVSNSLPLIGPPHSSRDCYDSFSEEVRIDFYLGKSLRLLCTTFSGSVA